VAITEGIRCKIGEGEKYLEDKDRHLLVLIVRCYYAVRLRWYYPGFIHKKDVGIISRSGR